MKTTLNPAYSFFGPLVVRHCDSLGKLQCQCPRFPHHSQTVTYCQYSPWPRSFLSGQLWVVAMELDILEYAVVNIVEFLVLSVNHFELFIIIFLLQAECKKVDNVNCNV